MRLTRTTIASKRKQDSFDSYTPSPEQIANAKAQRSLLDLLIAGKRQDVYTDQLFLGIATRVAESDALGEHDLSELFRQYENTLESILDSISRFRHTYSEALVTRHIEGAGASDSEVTVPQSSASCEVLPPAIVNQVDRHNRRSDLKHSLMRRAMRKTFRFEEATREADKELHLIDERTLLAKLGPGGDQTLDVYG